jgi:hypothetical protein
VRDGGAGPRSNAFVRNRTRSVRYRTRLQVLQVRIQPRNEWLSIANWPCTTAQREVTRSRGACEHGAIARSMSDQSRLERARYVQNRTANGRCFGKSNVRNSTFRARARKSSAMVGRRRPTSYHHARPCCVRPVKARSQFDIEVTHNHHGCAPMLLSMWSRRRAGSLVCASRVTNGGAPRRERTDQHHS